MSTRSRQLGPNELVGAAVGSWGEYWSLYTLHSGGKLFDFGAAQGYSNSAPFPIFSGVYGARKDLMSHREVLQLRKSLDSCHVPWIWYDDACGGINECAELLEAAGLQSISKVALMAADVIARDRDPNASKGAERVERMGTLEAFASVLVQSHQIDPCCGQVHYKAHAEMGFGRSSRTALFIKRDESGAAVSSAQVVFGEQVAVVEAVATVPNARGKGHAAALVHACLDAAADEGYRYAVLHSTEMGESLYRRLGFIEIGRRCFYMG